MDLLEEKYIDLMLRGCLDATKLNALLIHCDFYEHIEFAKRVAKRAKELGVNDVLIHVNDLDAIHSYLLDTELDDIKVNPLIDRSPWDEYAKKGGAILFLNSTVPGLMDDVPVEKVDKMIRERLKTCPFYRENVSRHTFPWTIVAVPNERWAKFVYGNDEEAYKKLYLAIIKMCMADKDDPVKAWEEYKEKLNYYAKRLSSLQIKTMHYTNSLGTDLVVTIPQGNRWLSIDKGLINGCNVMFNCPSFEVFTSPDARKTEGIVYGTTPFYFNGSCINDFSISFKNGKAVDCTAKQGQDVLENGLFKEEHSCYLGEVALVAKDSPVAQTGIVYHETLFDENAKPHLAVGSGFPDTFENYQNLSTEELVKKGLNIGSIHQDFMIGTDDLNIEAETNEGLKLIFKNGNFNL